MTPEQSARLRVEARAMAAVLHPNLAVIHGVETWQGTPFLIQVADGRVLKMVVEEYYSNGEQEVCNETGAMGDHSGYFKIRWAWLPPA